MQVAFLSPSSPRWSEVLTELDHDVYHLPGYAALFAQEEGGETIAFLAEEGRQRFFLPLIVRPIAADLGDGVHRFDATCPYGYPGPLLARGQAVDEDFLARAIAALFDGLRQRRIVAAFVRLHPLLPLPPAPLAQAGCLVHHGETVFIDLNRSDEAHWRDTQRHIRRDINRSRREGHVARIDEGWDRFDEFVDIYQTTMQRLGAGAFYFFTHDHFRRLREALGNRLHLCVVEIEGHVACAGIVTESHGIVECHLSGTRAEFLAQSPSKLRIDFLRRWAKARGNRLLHLGGGLGGRADGLFAFKAGFSKERAPFATWRLITDDAVYRSLIARWEADHGVPADGAGGFFPPYRKPSVVRQGDIARLPPSC